MLPYGTVCFAAQSLWINPSLHPKLDINSLVFPLYKFELDIFSFFVCPQIICEVTAFFLETPELTSPGFPSEDFYVGVKASIYSKKRVVVIFF